MRRWTQGRRTRPAAALAAVLVAALWMPQIDSASTAASSRAAAEVVAKESARNKAIAKRDSERRLRTLRLPPGSARSQGRPGGVGDRLGSPPATPAGIRFVTSHGFWTVPGDPRRVLGWLRHHAPPGAELRSEYGGSGGRALEFNWDRSPAGVWNASAIITVVARSTGGSAVRADVFDWWELPRSPAARIPAGTHYLGLRVSPGEGSYTEGEEDTRAPRFASTEEGRLIARVVRLINRQPAYQYTTLPSCGPEGLASESHLFTLTFRASRHGRVLARASQERPEGPCDALSLQVGRRGAFQLFGGWQMLRAVRGLIQRAVPERGERAGAPLRSFR
jgi:hypothetical protein